MPEHARETTDLRGVGEPVPRVVHQIWLQGGPVYPLLRPYVASVERVASDLGWRYQMWSEADVALLPADLQEVWASYLPRSRTPAQRSDVFRYLILLAVGGLYLDTDVELFSLPREICGAWIASTADHADKRIVWSCVNPCVMAVPPGHAFSRRLVAALASARWGVRNGIGPGLAWHQMGDDVSVWPVAMWHGGDAAWGKHLSLGERTETYRPYTPPTW